MKRYCSLCLSLAACVAAVAVSGLQLRADEKKPATQPAMGPAAMDPAAMMAAMAKAATPGAEHAALAKWAGEWDTVMEDNTTGEKSNGTAKGSMILGGRYLVEEFKGTVMGMPFEGISLTAYDNTSKQYVSTWIDSMGTGIAITHGKGDPNAHLEMNGTMPCPMTEEPVKMRTVTTAQGSDKRVMEMHVAGPDGKEMPAFRLTYTRKK